MLSGVVYAARDAGHRCFFQALDAGQPLPIDLRGQVIYYVGPSPAKPGRVIGSAGPTTSGRMDVYMPRLLAMGLKGTIGKGSRSAGVREAMKRHKAVYFAALGGAGALIARCIKGVELVAYGDLGPEALLRLEVEHFPLWVVNDIYGGDLYEQGKKAYQQT